MKRVKVTKTPLSPDPVRQFTNREIVSILGGLLGGLCNQHGVDVVREAVNWWAATPEAWELFDKERENFVALAESLMSKSGQHN